MKLSIADTIFDDFPDLVLGVVVLHDIDNSTDNPEITKLLRKAEAELSGKFGSIPEIDHPHISVWREAYRKFGAKPKDYPSSIENLTRRVLNGATIGHINNLVSLYNTISLRHILPVGGEDLDKITGDILLTRAGNDEPAVFLLGEKEARAPREGEMLSVRCPGRKAFRFRSFRQAFAGSIRDIEKPEITGSYGDQSRTVRCNRKLRLDSVEVFELFEARLSEALLSGTH